MQGAVQEEQGVNEQGVDEQGVEEEKQEEQGTPFNLSAGRSEVGRRLGTVTWGEVVLGDWGEEEQ